MRTTPSSRSRILGLLTAATIGVASLLAATPATAGVAPEANSPRLVIEDDFADPDVLLVDGVYHAYATNNDGMHKVQHRTSTNLRDWTAQPDAAPGLGEAVDDWVGPCRDVPGGGIDYCIWAPEVTTVEGGFALYYTARDKASNKQCIGVALADSPNGPFADPLGQPLVCPVDAGGAIDASTFHDGDDLYLIWKTDGNCCALPTIIYIQRLSADGLAVISEPVEILRNTLPWTGAVTEAPAITKHGDTYYLFFAANDYYGANYRTGWATADAIEGPYDVSESELLTTEDFSGAIRGPGGLDAFTTRTGDAAVLFHGWNEEYTYRGMYAADLEFGPTGVPHVVGAATRYEAEDAVVQHAAVRSEATASSLGAVGGMDFDDSSVTFTVDAEKSGPHTVGIRFSNGSLNGDGQPATATHRVIVNGEAGGVVDYWRTGWGNWQIVEVPVKLKKGANSISLQRDELFAELDVIYVAPGKAPAAPAVHPEPLADATRYEAEDGVIVHARVRADAVASDGAVVGGMDFADSSITVEVWSDEGGPSTVSVRFANGSERGGYRLTAEHALTVNGVDAGTLPYPHTGWGNWNYIDHPVDLEPGWNSVTLTRTAWYAEIDAIDVR